jgi:hypothetical protein
MRVALGMGWVLHCCLKTRKGKKEPDSSESGYLSNNPTNYDEYLQFHVTGQENAATTHSYHNHMATFARAV